MTALNQPASKRRASLISTLSGSFLALMLCNATIAAAPSDTQNTTTASRYLQRGNLNDPINVYWGDTHVHTRNSTDSYTFGNKTLSPNDAYQFAKGQPVTDNNGRVVQLQRPLDFLMVSDHAEFLGAFARIGDKDPAFLATSLGKRWRSYIDEGRQEKMVDEAGDIIVNDLDTDFPAALYADVWKAIGLAAERHNQPGIFTAFIGYEWSPTPDGNNLHRNVLFKDGAELTSQVVPFSSLDSEDPEDLWRYLQHYEDTTGGEVLAIPHNGNVSNGTMFALTTQANTPFTQAYAKSRMRWEPIYEVTQTKGDGETHPLLSPDDEFADFESWDAFNILRTQKKQPWMLQYEYARSAYKNGLAIDAKLSTNPFKFGMIGSTDSHTALSTTREDYYLGKYTEETKPGNNRVIAKGGGGRWWPNDQLGASGLAAVWANENTREGIYRAMKRKEVYATTGSRISVRFFGGWHYPPDSAYRADFVTIGYRGGVPMGGNLTQAPPEQAPRFLVSASKDPEGANLDRIQIIKGWLDNNGQLHEKVFDVALSDDRQVNPKTGKSPSLNSTVSVTEASYTNTVGSAFLSTVWQDPDFSAQQRAFYYARVLEIQKPRWPAYDAKAYNYTLPNDVALVIQDRAYTSPIWYTP